MSENTVTNVRTANGVAGEISVSATILYPGEAPRDVTFVGSAYGGPVVMVTPLTQVFVTNPSRCGDFAADRKAWIARFFA